MHSKSTTILINPPWCVFVIIFSILCVYVPLHLLLHLHMTLLLLSFNLSIIFIIGQSTIFTKCLPLLVRLFNCLNFLLF